MSQFLRIPEISSAERRVDYQSNWGAVAGKETLRMNFLNAVSFLLFAPPTKTHPPSHYILAAVEISHREKQRVCF